MASARFPRRQVYKIRAQCRQVHLVKNPDTAQNAEPAEILRPPRFSLGTVHLFRHGFFVNTANDVLKLQTELSEASGSQKIAEWFIGIGLAILLGAGISAIAGKESLLHVVPTPLCMVALSIHMRTQARRRTHDLESQLQR